VTVALVVMLMLVLVMAVVVRTTAMTAATAAQTKFHLFAAARAALWIAEAFCFEKLLFTFVKDEIFSAIFTRQESIARRERLGRREAEKFFNG
jgi:hypothetical protein